jgi:hypothetical protein
MRELSLLAVQHCKVGGFVHVQFGVDFRYHRGAVSQECPGGVNTGLSPDVGCLPVAEL